ncbi:RNA-dependent ATPase [Vermiconidia calcicola]|uniref:RNA-dependent ATPase n=1 Tax=Vermiconidia calcicola TaxID=1690605 RepID=A0ACC3NJ43_9PEZI|nr:RNA-dependent ATPase [Vermiconidia calcicola]
MAKRSREERTAEDDAGRTTKKVKKEKKEKSKTRTEEPAEANGDYNGQRDLVKENDVEAEDAKAAKAARKALRRSKKEQGKSTAVENTANNTVLKDSGYSSPATKEERKALKRAQKEAGKAGKSAALEDGSEHNQAGMQAGGNDAALVTAATGDATDVAYREHEELTALPQTEIDSFVSDRLLSVEDPRKQTYRPIVSFKYLPVGDEVDRAPFADFSTPTPIQAACWPYLFAGRDVVGVAETGSGKTLAFGVPCIRYIARMKKKDRRGILSCMVSPTRELAMQIHEQLAKLAEPAGLKVAVVYGGVNKDVQRETLNGANIIVATPGRLNDFIQEGSINLSKVKYLVLDEADRMLDTGFEEEVKKIISETDAVGRQTLMFTATWPPSVRDLASTFMDSPVKVTIGDNASGELRANARISQEVEVIEEMQKQSRLIELLKQYQSGKNKNDRILVFCLYKKEATRIEEFIRRRGFSVAGIHGDLGQQKRTESLDAFKKGKVPLLVATDVAARGLDIPAVKVVINVTFPLTVEDYVHRIGRTGRAGQTGKAVTLFTTNEKGLAGGLINVLKAANQPVPEELLKFGTTVKKKSHDAYGAFYKDVGAGEMKKATKITFD